MIDSYDKLYFAIKSNTTYITKGAFDYKNYIPKKDNDLSSEYKKIQFIDNKIQIFECKEIAKNVDTSGLGVRYSSKTNSELIDELTFEELKDSEYWNLIIDRYKYNQKEYDNYKENEIYEDREEINTYLNFNGRYLDIRFNKLDGYLSISSNDKDIYFEDYIGKLIVQDYDTYLENKTNNKIIELMKNHNVQLLENGYVIDNKYYEDIDDYEEKVDE